MLPLFAGSCVILGIFPMIYLIDAPSFALQHQSSGEPPPSLDSSDAPCNETALLDATIDAGSFELGSQYAIMCTVALIGGVISTVAGSNIRAIMLNVNAPETRGTVFSVFALTDDLGKGLGPAMGAMFVSYFGSRQRAFNVTIFFWLLCGGLMASQFFTLERDERRLQMSLAKGAEDEAALCEMVVEEKEHDDDDDDDIIKVFMN